MSNTANLWILLGTLLIAAGGILATYGWNLRSTVETYALLERSRAEELAARREGVIRSVAAEAVVNAEKFESKALTEENETALSKYARYPRFETTALATAITSGLFVGPEDKELFTILTHLHGALSELNETLAILDQEMRRRSGPEVLIFRRKVHASPLLTTSEESLGRLLVLLTERYGIGMDESFHVPYSQLRDAPTTKPDSIP